MATAGTATRIDAERYSSDQAVAARALKASFDIEILADDWRVRTQAENIQLAATIISDLEQLAAETVVRSAAKARALRTAANELRRAVALENVADGYNAVCEALQLVEGL